MKVIQGTRECAPSEVGYDETRLDAVNGFFQCMIDNKVIHGVSYRLARNGKVFASAALGSRHYKKSDVLLKPETNFRIASQTKMFAAFAIQLLVEDGLLSVEDKVADYLPQFDSAPYNEITITHLLTHTSGLSPEGSIPDKYRTGAWEFIEEQAKIDGLNTDWLAAGLKCGLRRPPGTEWQYCSFGTVILGAVITKLTGINCEKFILDRICKPLRMDSTTFDPSYEALNNGVIFDKYTEDEIKNTKKKNNEKSVWDDVPRVGGGLYSNTADLIRFGIMMSQWGQYDGVRIIGRKAIESMIEQRLFNIPNFCWGANDNDRRYGLGVDLRRFPGSLTSVGTYFHEGAGHSVMIIDPVEKMVCSCVYPWVKDWDAACNGRLSNVIWSGLI